MSPQIPQPYGYPPPPAFPSPQPYVNRGNPAEAAVYIACGIGILACFLPMAGPATLIDAVKASPTVLLFPISILVTGILVALARLSMNPNRLRGAAAITAGMACMMALLMAAAMSFAQSIPGGHAGAGAYVALASTLTMAIAIIFTF